MRVLLVKLSSLGDVIHNFPVAQDLRRAFPDCRIDWVTEAPYAPLVAQHAAVSRVFPVRLRALKRRWWSFSAWANVFDDKAAIASTPYDLIVDTQGLMKSAVVAGWANGSVLGYDADSAREPMSAKLYDHRVAVGKALHAVERNRALGHAAAARLGAADALATACDYGFSREAPTTQPTAVLLHATSRVEKEWPETHWVALGQSLRAQGVKIQLLAGTPAELARSTRIAAQIEGASALPTMPLTETADVLAQAAMVVGVDTGLAHLAVALGRPTVGLYCNTAPALTGLYAGTAGRCRNLGGVGTVPSVEDALLAIQEVRS